MLAAAVLAGTQCLGFRLLAQAVALVATVATIVICGLQLALAIRHGVAVYWFGGWHPHHGVALGISFAIDPFGAGLACFCAVLTLAAQVFSWRHFESVGHAFPALLLVLMAAIIGFCESGDLFNMFVFFELMTATAIALTAHRSDQRAPLQGALNFGISNAIGGFLVLVRDRVAVRPDRRAEPGADRRGTGWPPRRWTGRGRVRADRLRLLRQGGDHPISLLAGRRVCERADAGVRDLRRGDERGRAVWRRAGVLDRVRRAARSARGDAAADPGADRRGNGARGRGDVPAAAAAQTAAGVRDDQLHGAVPGRSRDA